MSIFVFSTYVNELKNSWHDSISNEDLINLLFNAIVLPLNVCDKKGNAYYIDKSVASKLINRESNVSPRIKKASTEAAVLNSICSYFSTQILPCISNGLEAQLIKGLQELITNDPSIANATRQRLLTNAREASLADFLADLFLYTVKIKNKPIETKELKEASNSDLPIQHKSPRLVELLPPENVTEQELPYIRALLEAYTDHEGCSPLSIDSLDRYTKFKENFIRQRKNYYAAESVRRGVRDSYCDDAPNQFDVFEDEIYNGIIEVWEDEYKSGYQRLNKVMIQSVNVQLDRCWLAQETDWIGANQRKGVCHVLVNEEKLNGWVKKDE